MREIKTDSKIKFAIVSIIFLSGLFFGINFSNTNSDFGIKPAQTNEDGIIVETKLYETFQEKDIFQRNGEESISRQELIEFALEEINSDRLEHGLSPVKLGNNQAAQFHVEDMMMFGYFSHWNTNGVKPYVTYTEYGGRAYVKENIAASWCEGLSCKMEPFELVKKFQHLMVYEDDESNWGHRDNILDPNHSLVNIGIVWNDNNFYYAQHFETKLIDFNQIDLSDNKILKISGKIHDGYNLKSITLFQDDKPLSLNGQDLESNSPYNQNFYDTGILAGILVKKPPFFGFYEECQKDRISIFSNKEEFCIPYKTYDQKIENNTFEIVANVSDLLDEKNLHTIYINLEDQNGNFIITSSITLEFL